MLYKNGSGIGRPGGNRLLRGLPGNTFGVATMVDMDEASKPKSELWATNADAHSRTAEDLTTTGLTTPVPGWLRIAHIWYPASNSPNFSEPRGVGVGSA